MTSHSTHPDSDASLQLAYQRLLALERFKSGFLARTSHEMRSPINTIVSLHQLILEDLCEGPEEEKEFIDQSKNAALKMLSLFDQITAVSKLDVGREPAKLTAVDLSFLLPEVEMLTTLQAANQNVRYSVESPTDEVEIQTDQKWLKNILASLIQDAIAHTKTLKLSVESNKQTVVIAIESDRPAAALQSELDQISGYVAPDSTQGADSSARFTEMQLSTGLILATAHTALPLINGSFAITASDTDADRSLLKCTFER